MKARRHGGPPLRVLEVLVVLQEAISNRVPALSSPTVCFRLHETRRRPAHTTPLMVKGNLLVVHVCVAEAAAVAAGVEGLEVLHALHVFLIALGDALLLLRPSADGAHARPSVLVVEARVRRRAVLVLFLLFELLELLHLGLDHRHFPGRWTGHRLGNGLQARGALSELQYFLLLGHLLDFFDHIVFPDYLQDLQQRLFNRLIDDDVLRRRRKRLFLRRRSLFGDFSVIFTAGASVLNTGTGEAILPEALLLSVPRDGVD